MTYASDSESVPMGLLPLGSVMDLRRWPFISKAGNDILDSPDLELRSSSSSPGSSAIDVSSSCLLRCFLRISFDMPLGPSLVPPPLVAGLDTSSVESLNEGVLLVRPE